jgi:transposase
MEIVLAGMASGANNSAVCREYGILQPQYYKWKEAFLQGGLSALATSPSKREQELEIVLKKPRHCLVNKQCRLRSLEKRAIGAEGKFKRVGTDLGG